MDRKLGELAQLNLVKILQEDFSALLNNFTPTPLSLYTILQKVPKIL